MDRSERVVAAAYPVVMELQPGVYEWCRCGRSGSQPFCDGVSHRGTGIDPLVFEVKERRRAALCRCKQTTSEPFCNGSHQQFRE
jgi:CDGSH-type Zn-finger protein